MAEAIGYHYGRADLERVGIFAEMGYLHGKGYTAPTASKYEVFDNNDNLYCTVICFTVQ